jgi:Fe-S-cluster containining protein
MDFTQACRKCSRSSHCCIFKDNLGFTFLSLSEAKSIKNRTKSDFDYFLDYSPLSKRAKSALRHCDPALEGALRYSQLDKKGRILRLRTKKDGRCIFLTDTGKCEIYSIRPRVCKIYPFWAMRLTSGKIKIILHDPEPKCQVIVKNKDAELEKALSQKEINEIKNIFKCIEKENPDFMVLKKL